MDRKEKKQLVIDMPYVVEKNKKYMGGTDRQDLNGNKYCIGIRWKK